MRPGTRVMTKDIKEQVEQAKKEFTQFSFEALDEVEKAILKSAQKVEADAKKSFRSSNEESEPDAPPRNQTGRLRASITHRLKKDDKETYAEVGTNVNYGLWLEFGTSKMKPHPFLTPAFEQNKESIQDYIARAIKKAADNAGR